MADDVRRIREQVYETSDGDAEPAGLAVADARVGPTARRIDRPSADRGRIW